MSFENKIFAVVVIVLLSVYIIPNPEIAKQRNDKE